MNKREHRNGDSPAAKKICDPSYDFSDADIFSSQSQASQNNQSQLIPASMSPVPLDSQASIIMDYSLLSENSTQLEGLTPESFANIDEETFFGQPPQDLNQSLEVSEEDPDDFLEQAIAKSIQRHGLKSTVQTLLKNENLKKMIVTELNLKSHTELQSSLSRSQLSSDKMKRDRNYLLKVTPKSVCEEFQKNAPTAFALVLQGLLGVSDVQTLLNDSKLMNRVAVILSTVATHLNRKATGYAMVLTAAARDGGLREDSLKLFVFFVHPSTMQRYDRNVLAKDWDQARKKALEAEKLHFLALQSGELLAQKLYYYCF